MSKIHKYAGFYASIFHALDTLVRVRKIIQPFFIFFRFFAGNICIRIHLPATQIIATGGAGGYAHASLGPTTYRADRLSE